MTDSHFYELTAMEMPVLSKIRVRACSNLTAFTNIYLQKLVEKQSRKNIEKVRRIFLLLFTRRKTFVFQVIELTDDPLTPLKALTKSIDETVSHLETPFGPVRSFEILQFFHLVFLNKDFKRINYESVDLSRIS